MLKTQIFLPNVIKMLKWAPNASNSLGICRNFIEFTNSLDQSINTFMNSFWWMNSSTSWHMCAWCLHFSVRSYNRSVLVFFYLVVCQASGGWNCVAVNRVAAYAAVCTYACTQTHRQSDIRTHTTAKRKRKHTIKIIKTSFQQCKQSITQWEQFDTENKDNKPNIFFDFFRKRIVI